MAFDVQVAIIGSNGSMGTLLASMLSRAGAHVSGIDLDPQPRHSHCATYWSVDATDAASVREFQDALNAGAWCFACLPESAGLAFVDLYLARAPRAGLVVDTFSTKTSVFELYDAKADLAAARSVDILSINPLFRPELGFDGRPTAVVQGHVGAAGEAFLARLRSWRTRIVLLESAAEHDRRMASVQSLTHAAVLAFGLALTAAGYRFEDARALAPPPHTLLLMLLARVIDAGPAVYWDIQSANPYASEVRARLLEGIERLDATVRGGDADEFARIFGDIRASLDPGLEELASACATVIQQSPEG